MDHNKTSKLMEDVEKRRDGYSKNLLKNPKVKAYLHSKDRISNRIINHFKNLPPKRLLDYWIIFLMFVIIAAIISSYI